MNLLQYIELVKAFAATDPDLNHQENINEAVFCVDIDDAQRILNETHDRMILFIPPYDKYVHDNKAMGNIWIKEGLAIALQYVDLDDHQTMIAIQAKAEAVLDRLYSFLFNCRNTDYLYGFDPKSWKSEPIGPVGDNHYGYFSSYNIKDAVLL